MKRKLALLLTIAVGGFGVLAWWASTAPGINQRTADRLTGMTLHEVEGLIGKPGVYTTSLLDANWSSYQLPTVHLDRVGAVRMESWISDAGHLQVLSDRHNNVVASTFTAYRDPLLNKIKRALGMTTWQANRP